MEAQAFLFAKILFWIVAACIVFLPHKWAVFSFLLIVHIDPSGPGFASASSVGFENTLKVLVLPTVLLLRTNFKPLQETKWPLALRAWALFIFYVVIATLWSPFQLSAVKMIGYLYCYFAQFIIFTYAWAKGWISYNVIVINFWIVLFLAVIQTYLVGNPFGSGENRFTSFSSPQYFAAYLISILSIILFSGKSGTIYIGHVVVLMVALLLTGSRYAFIGSIFLLLILGCIKFFSKKTPLGQFFILTMGLFAIGITLVAINLLPYYLPESRLNELLKSGSSGGGIESVGTLSWRLGVYQELEQQINTRNVLQLMFGSGTSSGANLMLGFFGYNQAFAENSIDANRILHNEFLRSLYEWGIIGTLILVYFLIVTFFSYLKLAIVNRSSSALAFIGIFPTIIFSLAIENTFAGGGSPVGVGYVLVMSYGVACQKGY